MEALGEIDRVGCLYPTGDPGAEPSVDAIVAGAEALGIEVDARPFASPDDVPGALQAVADGGADAVLLASTPATVQAFPALREALPEVGIPLVANTEVDVALLVLQPDRDTVYRQLARQTARLFGGASVSETPVEDPGRFELVVNLGVAEDLGVELPERFVERADRVIR
jgi:putative ABC transport system substrate-binding protein